ncbi:acyl-coenzyme A thioesterase 8 isoform X1 [Ciconia boyciana]|uniref:acyl-coenzyme A thioesterase 8 isoform X1 n=1 Tax=Ciconia boyciana TaxID=52775 RepID=UPI003BA0E1B7
MANQRRPLRIGRRRANQPGVFCHTQVTDGPAAQSAGGPRPAGGRHFPLRRCCQWHRFRVAEEMAAAGDAGGAGAGPGPGPPPPPPGDLRSVLITSVLNLEQLDLDLFRGRQHWVPATQRLFGGQIVGQALVAAARAVSRDEQLHSLHCYFVRAGGPGRAGPGPGEPGCGQWGRAGDPKVPVLYQVERTRTGKSFSVRSVKAIQHGKPIFTCQASFQLSQGSPVQHQYTMPAVPPPEELLTQEELIQKFLQNPNLAERYRKHLNKIQAEDVPIDIKPVNPPDIFRLEPQEPKQFFWVRARGYIGETDMKVHCCVAAYISDYAFLGTALLPHRQYRVKFMVSLDHSMWFHAPFRADHWMLYECESPWAGGCRGLVQGRLWRRDGVLAVTCAQEGVIRVEQTPNQSKL